MSIKKFSIKESLIFGWGIMKSNFWFFVGLLLIIWSISLVYSIIEDQTKEQSVLSFVIGLTFFALNIIITMGAIKIALKFHDGQKGKIADLFSCFRLFFKYLLGLIVYGLIVLVGLVLLIIPGIIWAIKYQFFGYFIVDKELGPIEALKQSAKITKDAKWTLLFFGSLSGLINFLGALLLLVGLFATVPTIMMAKAFVYRKLLDQVNKV